MWLYLFVSVVIVYETAVNQSQSQWSELDIVFDTFEIYRNNECKQIVFLFTKLDL